MISNPNGLSQAVVLCLGYGVTIAPIFDVAKLVEIHGQKKGMDLFNDVRKLTDEAAQIPIDWGSTSLEVAGKKVHAEMHSRYPYLDNKALAAIAWKFTFDWR